MPNRLTLIEKFQKYHKEGNEFTENRIAEIGFYNVAKEIREGDKITKNFSSIEHFFYYNGCVTAIINNLPPDQFENRTKFQDVKFKK